MPKISFYNADIKLSFPEKAALKKFIPLIFLQEKKQLNSLSIIFCSDAYLLTLNKEYLQHDYYTDIITFDLSSGAKIDGEVYISIDRIKENSVLHNVSFPEELLRIIFHGTLHLCGYGDKTSFEKQEMTNKEDKCIEQYLTFHVKQ